MQRSWQSVLYSVCLCCATVDVFAGEPTAARADFTAAPPVLNGKLDDTCWSQAARHGGFHLHKSGGQLSEETTFQMAYDNNWLYFGMRCRNENLHRFTPKHQNPEDPVSTDDSVELFLDPTGTGRVYLHYMLACNNVRAEQIVRNGVKQRTWNVPWLSATSRDGEGWTAEIALPLCELISHGNLEALKFNITRNRRLIDSVDGQGEILTERIEASTWQPVIINFHEPDRFAPLAGIAPQNPSIPLLVALEDAVVHPYTARDEGLAYEVEVVARNVSGRVGEVEITVGDSPRGGAASETVKRFKSAGPAPERWTIPVPVTSMSDRIITVTLRDPAAGHEMGRRVVENPETLRLMTAYADRNYYTDETNAVITAAIGMPPENLKGMLLAARAEGRAGGEAAAAPETRIALPIADWPVGTHTVHLELCQEAGRVLFSQPLVIVKRAPKPGREWKIDHVNRIILRDGHPFFGLSMTMVMAGHDPEHITQCIAEYGFNTYFMWINWDDPDRGFSGFTTADVVQHAQLAERHGLYFVARPEAAYGGRKGEYGGDFARPYFELLPPEKVEQQKQFLAASSMLRLKGTLYGGARSLNDAQKTAFAFGHYQYHLASMLESLAAIQDAGNLFGYKLFDEPCIWQFSALLDFYQKINELDGYHPQLVLFSGAPPKGAEDQTFYDVLGQDPYWQPGGNGYRGWPRYVAAATAGLYRRAAARRAPVWITLAAEFFGGCRPMTVAEQECQTWLGIINGATYINYFHSSNIAHADTWNTFKRLNAIIMELSPALTAPAVKQTVAYRSGRRATNGGGVEYHPGEFDPDKWKYPDVQAVLKRFPDGRGLLLAANCFDRHTRCEFELPGLAGTVSNRVSGTAQEVRDGKFSDEFPGYGIAAYYLDLPEGGQPPALTVSSVVNAEDIKASEEPFILQNYVRPGKKNVLPNPSFENATLPGYPDYYFMYAAMDPEQAIGSGSPPVWGQSTEEVFHGQYSMLISCPSTNTPPSRHGPAGARFYCQPQHDQTATYAFSFYAKADRPGMRLLYHSEYGSRTFELTTDWRRYNMLWQVPPRSDADLFRFEIAAKCAGRIWMDAMQVEQGLEATEFEE